MEGSTLSVALEASCETLTVHLLAGGVLAVAGDLEGGALAGVVG